MSRRKFLPAVADGRENPNPMARLLSQSIAKVVTPGEVEAIVKQIVEEAKTGSGAEKHRARQLLLGLMGAKSPTTNNTYVQNNTYVKGTGTGKAGQLRSLIWTYLEKAGPSGEDMIADGIQRPRDEVLRALKSSRDLFRRVPSGAGQAWDVISG